MLYAILPAAGEGLRMQGMGGTSKQFLPLRGESVLNTTLQALWHTGLIDGLIVVVPKGKEQQFSASIKDLPFFDRIIVVTGGRTRSQSVANGLKVVPLQVEYVVVHDGVRPLVSKNLLERVVNAAYQTGAAICGVPVTDTVKRVSSIQHVEDTLLREGLYTIQTPQVFKKEILLSAYQQNTSEDSIHTDDASLVEAIGHTVMVVPGDPLNIKITHPQDLFLVKLLLKEKEAQSMRIGMGYDVHRLVPGRELILGGVKIPHETGLEGHSDADVLLHAIIDALLGAVALGDIGKHFPDTDPKYLNASSLDLLIEAHRLLQKKGYSCQQIDAVITAEKPKLAGYIENMRENIAHALDMDISFVSVKATTCEGLGFVGEQRGMEAKAIATVICSS